MRKKEQKRRNQLCELIDGNFDLAGASVEDELIEVLHQGEGGNFAHDRASES